MIIIYTQPTCGQCRAVKMLLDQKKIPFVACEDIEKMSQLGIMHTPTLQTPDGRLLIGKDIIEWIRNYSL